MFTVFIRLIIWFEIFRKSKKYFNIIYLFITQNFSIEDFKTKKETHLRTSLPTMMKSLFIQHS